jgi:hypothetical protein
LVLTSLTLTRVLFLSLRSNTSTRADLFIIEATKFTPALPPASGKRRKLPVEWQLPTVSWLQASIGKIRGDKNYTNSMKSLHASSPKVVRNH